MKLALQWSKSVVGRAVRLVSKPAALLGLLALGLTLLMVRLLNKKVNPVWLIFALFGLGIIGNALGFLS